MVSFIPTLEARAFDILGEWHHVRELKIRRQRGTVKRKIWRATQTNLVTWEKISPVIPKTLTKTIHEQTNSNFYMFTGQKQNFLPIAIHTGHP